MQVDGYQMPEVTRMEETAGHIDTCVLPVDRYVDKKTPRGFYLHVFLYSPGVI